MQQNESWNQEKPYSWCIIIALLKTHKKRFIYKHTLQTPRTHLKHVCQQFPLAYHLKEKGKKITSSFFTTCSKKHGSCSAWLIKINFKTMQIIICVLWFYQSRYTKQWTQLNSYTATVNILFLKQTSDHFQGKILIY